MTEERWELWFVPSDGRAEQKWLGPSPLDGPSGAERMRNNLHRQMRMGAGRLELRPA